VKQDLRPEDVPELAPGSPADEPADATSVAAIAGDPDAMRALWRENRRWVAAILLAHKPRWADVEDLLQEVALSMVRKVSEVRDPRAIRPWLRTVAMNAAHAAARSGRRRARDVGMMDETGEERFVGDASRRGIAPPGAPSEQVTDLDEGRRLMELAAQLPDGYREPLLLKALQNLSYREIGQILGLPETTVETRIARGRRQLRDLALGNVKGIAGASPDER
jgi:RNA polymerase sigma-70 factor (ECF subfamily)